MISQSLERKKFLEKCTRNHSINAKLAANEINGAPGQSRTGDLRFRKPTLYPSELREQWLTSWFTVAWKMYARNQPSSISKKLPRRDFDSSGDVTVPDPNIDSIVRRV